MSFFVFDTIEIEYEFDYSIYSEISPWAYFRVKTVSVRKDIETDSFRVYLQ